MAKRGQKVIREFFVRECLLWLSALRTRHCEDAGSTSGLTPWVKDVVLHSRSKM